MPLPVTTPNAQVVKDSTSALHAGVESLLVPKLQALRSHDGYAAILQMFYGFFSPIEGLIRQQLTGADLPDLDSRRKALVILHDLQALKFSIRGLAVCTQLPPINSRAAAFGAMYVLEGSTLGGKQISKMLLCNEALALPENAVGFFAGYRQFTGEKWKSFLSAFNELEDTATLATSANATFLALKRWMQQTLYHG